MRRVWIVVFCLMLVGCSQDPMNAKLPQSIDDAKDFREKIDSLESEDKRLLSEFMEPHLLGMALGVAPPDITIGEAISEQKEIEQKAKDKQSALQEAVNTMNDVLNVEYVHYDKFEKASYPAYKFTVEMINKKAKPIIGVKGRLIFKDLFGKDVGNISVETKTTLDKDQPRYVEITTVPFITQGDNFKDGSYTSENVRFEPEVIVFADKTLLSIEGG